MDELLRQHLDLATDNDIQFVAILAGLLPALHESGHLTAPALEEILADASRRPHDHPPLVVSDIRFRVSLDR